MQRLCEVFGVMSSCGSISQVDETKERLDSRKPERAEGLACSPSRVLTDADRVILVPQLVLSACVDTSGELP